MPDSARSLVLIVDDPDAPDPTAPKMTSVHWVLCNIPPDASELVEGVTSEQLSPGALDTVLPGMNKPTKAQVEAAMQGHIIAEAQLMGTYEKSSGR